MHRNRLVSFTAALALAAGLGAAPADAADYIMKYGHPGPAGELEDDHAAGLFLKQYLESRSNGQIEVQIFPASQLGSFREMVEGVQAGAIELAHSNVAGLAGFMPELQLLELPYVVRDDLVAECLIESSFFDEARAEFLERTGTVRLVGVGNTGRWRSFYTANKPVRTAEDLRGVKMRVINSPLAAETVRFFGGNPTPIAWGELYTSLATGVVEGTKNAVTDIIPNKMDEVIRYGVLDEHAYLWGFMVLSDTWLKSLPAELQPLVVDGVKQMAAVQLNFNKLIEASTTAAFLEGGGEIYVPTPEEKATFEAAKEPMGEWFVEQYGSEWYDKFIDAASACEEQVDAELAELGGL